MVEHGGRLRRAAARYAIPLADWLDLSTGINPDGWPVPEVPAAAWSRLPEDEDELTQIAGSYYGAHTLLPVAGSQAAIQALPLLRAPCRVAVIHPGYAEHAHAWRQAGHAVTLVDAVDIDNVVPHMDALVLIHPNNPTGARFPPTQLLDWHARLAARGGWLVLDEAFMDATPAESLAPFCPRPGLIVLRSLGKFFGLAGARVGFVLAETTLLENLRAQLGPWNVAGPSRWVAARALADIAWQRAARARLADSSAQLAALLHEFNLEPRGGCALFQWVPTPHAVDIHEHLARRGVLTRLFKEPLSLRFGLPKTETDWTRLNTALSDTLLNPLSLRERARVRSHEPVKTLTRTLRHRATDAERLLWRHLRDRRLGGFKFRRQLVIEPYIVDFACLEAKLIVEADGGQHTDQEKQDAARTEHLERMGYRVLRFWNHEILNDVESVLERILGTLKKPPHPIPLPEGEGEGSATGEVADNSMSRLLKTT